jgi:predicted  nucleic acid-binding Zn-ribbon protein
MDSINGGNPAIELSSTDSVSDYGQKAWELYQDKTEQRMPTVQETSIGEQLKALIRLQHIDSRIDQIEKLRGDLPDEIRDLEDEKEGLDTRIEKLKQEELDNEVAKRRGGLDIEEAEMLIKKYEEQQLQVRNNREYDALTKEIESQKQRIVDAQNRIQEISDNAESHGLAIEAAQARLNDLDEILKSKRTDLKEVLDDTKQEQGALQKKRNEAAEEVDARYLRAYDRLRNRLRDGRAVVPLERGAAAGFAVPPQRQVEIRQGNRIVACEHTGRIIVDSEMYFDTVEGMQI